MISSVLNVIVDNANIFVFAQYLVVMFNISAEALNSGVQLVIG